MGAAQKFRRFRKDTICVQAQDQPSWRLKLPGSQEVSKAFCFSTSMFWKILLNSTFDSQGNLSPSLTGVQRCALLEVHLHEGAKHAKLKKANKSWENSIPISPTSFHSYIHIYIYIYYYIDNQKPSYSSSGFSWFQLTARTHGLKRPLQSPCSFGPLPSQDPRLCRTPNPGKLTMLAALCFRQTTHWQIPSCWDTELLLYHMIVYKYS